MWSVSPMSETVPGRIDWPTPTVRDRESVAKLTRGAHAMAGGTPLVLAVIASDASISSAPGSPVSRCPWPASNWDWRMIDGSGRTWGDSFASYDRPSSSWKTCQGSLFTDSPASSVIWPRSGMTRSGRAYEQVTWARRTDASASSSLPLWPTPNVPNGWRSATSDSMTLTGMTPDGEKRQVDLAFAVQQWQTPCAKTNRKSARAMTPSVNNGKRSGGGMSSPPGLEQQVELSVGVLPRELWPTPRAEDSESAGARVTRGTADTLTAATRLWPTPTESDGDGAGNRNLPGSQAHAGLSLTDVVTGGQAPRRWMTPQARDWKGISQAPATKGTYSGGLPDQLAGLRDQANPSSTGNRPGSSVVLSPAWVSCLMGFPPDWCDIGDVSLPR
jgi:hypothetical protein